MRPLLPYLAAALVCGSVAELVRAAPRGRAAKVTVSKKTLRPGKVLGGGSEIFLRVQVKAKRATVSLVEGQVRIPGYAGPKALLEPNGRGAFQGTVQVPVNRSRRTVKATVHTYVTTAEGSAPVQRRVGTLKVLPYDDSSPPPPPPN